MLGPSPGLRPVLLLAFAFAVGVTTAGGCGEVLNVEEPKLEPDASSEAGGPDGRADVSMQDARTDVPPDAGSCRAGHSEDFNVAMVVDERWSPDTKGAGAYQTDTAEFHGATGAALRFDVASAGDEASLSRPVGGDCPFAMSLWFKRGTATSTKSVFGRLRVGVETIVVAFDGANIRLEATPTSRVWIGAPKDGAWHELLLTYRADSRTAALSIDGATPGTITLPPGNGAVEHLGLGLLQVAGADRLFVDDLRIE